MSDTTDYKVALKHIKFCTRFMFALINDAYNAGLTNVNDCHEFDEKLREKLLEFRSLVEGRIKSL